MIGAVTLSSCKKFLDINTDPDSIISTSPPLAQLLTSAEVNLAFEGGSDLYRYSAVIAQHLSGQASQPNQTYEYSRYNISGSDENNVWSNIFSTTLSDIELLLQGAATTNSPYYAGIAKILKAYEYQLVVDAWGNAPYSEAQKLTDNTRPKFDNGEDIYKNIIVLLTEAVANLNAATSNLTPGTNSTIYTNGGNFTLAKAQWIKLANTLKMRIFLHYSKKDPTFMVAQMNALISSGATFMTGTADNFQMSFYAVANQTNSIHQFETNRANYLFADNRIVSLMNSKADPRRTTYFTPFPYASSPATYKGVTPGDLTSVNFSRIHTYLRGAASGTPTPNAQGGITATALTYTGAAPIRMLTYAEYCFIRAEAILKGVPAGTVPAETWFQNGITASMQDAGVSATDITTYLAANGGLTGTDPQKQQKISEEKYVALYGVSMEPWTEYRRTGYPTLTPPSNAATPGAPVPRSLFYPQSEVDLNPNAPTQKADLNQKVFWDN